MGNRFGVAVYGSRIQVSVNGVSLINYVDANPIRKGGVGVINDASAKPAEASLMTNL